jgi:hypothetical protein
MPVWKRFAIATPVAIVLFWVGLSLQAWAWTEVSARMVASEMDAEVEYKDSFFDLHGGFGATDVRFTKFSPDGEDSVTYRIDRVTLQTPGLRWFIWNTLFDTSNELPDRVGIVLDNPRNVADDDTTPGNYTNLPFDAMGCVASALTPTDLRTMGVSTQRQVTVTLSRDSDTQTTGLFRMRTEGAGELDMQVKLELQRPVDMATWGEQIEAAPLQSVQMQFTDLGYIAKRNAYCAKKHGMTAAAWADYHMQEVARFSGAQGMAYGQGTLAQYRDFAEKGGTLLLRTAGTRKLSIMEFVQMDRLRKMQAYPVMIAANGKAPANFSYGFDPNAAAVAAAADGAVDVPVANLAPTPVANAASGPVAAGQLPEPGAIVPHESLAALTGRHIDVTTTYGSTRKGILALVGPLAINVQLDKEEGGLNLTMPTNSITEIRYTPIDTPADPPTATQ